MSSPKPELSPEQKLEKVNKTAKVLGWIIVTILGLIVLSIVLVMGGSQADSAGAVIGGFGLMVFLLAVGIPALGFLSIAWGVMKLKASSIKANLNSSSSSTPPAETSTPESD